MRRNETQLVASFEKQLLTAKGYNLEHRLIVKALKMNAVYWKCNGGEMSREERDRISKKADHIRKTVRLLFRDLVFNKRVPFDELNEFYKSINDGIVINGITNDIRI